MRDYWLTQSLLQAVGIGFGLLALTGLALALWLPKKWWGKLLGVAVVVFLISIPVRKVMQEQATQQVKADDYKERYAKAKALFDERCKTAGEKIYRTVENVQGVFLMNMRPEKVASNDQFERYDPYGYEGGGTEYVKEFLAGHWKTCVGAAPNCTAGKRAFQYVEHRTDIDSVYRYISIDGQTGQPFTKNALSFAKLVSEKISTPTTRYGVEWADVSTNEDRKYWIAGGEIKIVDLITKEVIAVRRGYLMDTGQGDTSGQRQPWSWTRHYNQGCPVVENHNFTFIRSVLKPTQGE